MARAEDCLECKLVGSGAMGALSAYFTLNALRAPRVTQTLASLKNINSGFALLFAAAALARLAS